MSLAEKVKRADAASSDMSISPPRTATRHNSTRAGNLLRRIDEEHPDALASGTRANKGAADEVRPAAMQRLDGCRQAHVRLHIGSLQTQ